MLVLLQYRLWLSPDGIAQYFKFKKQIARVHSQNVVLQATNKALVERVWCLKKADPQEIEAEARGRFGLIKKNEIFYRVVH